MRTDRCRRLSLLDAWMAVGFMLGNPTGVWLRNTYGLVTLYIVATATTLAAIIYVLFLVVEPDRGQTKTSDQQLHCDKSEEHTFIIQYRPVVRILSKLLFPKQEIVKLSRLRGVQFPGVSPHVRPANPAASPAGRGAPLGPLLRHRLLPQQGH